MLDPLSGAKSNAFPAGIKTDTKDLQILISKMPEDQQKAVGKVLNSIKGMSLPTIKESIGKILEKMGQPNKLQRPGDNRMPKGDPITGKMEPGEI